MSFEKQVLVKTSFWWVPEELSLRKGIPSLKKALNI